MAIQYDPRNSLRYRIATAKRTTVVGFGFLIGIVMLWVSTGFLHSTDPRIMEINKVQATGIIQFVDFGVAVGFIVSVTVDKAQKVKWLWFPFLEVASGGFLAGSSIGIVVIVPLIQLFGCMFSNVGIPNNFC